MVEIADHVGQVLVQGAAQVDVEDLAAPADGEDRHVGLEGGGQEGPFTGVPIQVDAPDLGVRVRTVGGGVQVATAGEDEGVEHGDDVGGAGGGAARGRAGRREEEGTTAGGGHQLEVGLGQDGGPALPRGPGHVGHIGRDADERDHLPSVHTVYAVA